MPERSHLFHKLALRWQPLFTGYRTIFVLLMGYPPLLVLTWRVYQTGDEHLAGVMMWMAGIYTVLLLAYPISKGMTGVRNRWSSYRPSPAPDPTDPGDMPDPEDIS